MSKPLGAILLVEIKFRHLLSTGKSVAIEDAAKSVVLPEGFDKRAFGGIPRAMVATDKLAAKPRGERSRG